jgi:hypothetical protein
MRTLAVPKMAEPWSLAGLRKKPIKISANVPRQMFADILSLIARLRAPPAPA